MTLTIPREINFKTTFEVQEKRIITGEVCAVTGMVTAGVFCSGDIVAFVDLLGDRYTGSILSLMKDGRNVVELYEGDVGALTLRTDPRNIMVGDQLENLGRKPRAKAAPKPVQRPAKSHVVMERPVDLEVVESRIRQGAFRAAKQLLGKYRERHPTSLGAQRLLASLYLDRASPYFDAPKGLAIIRSVHGQCKIEDPAVTALLATALAENGDPEMGLQVMERAYAHFVDGEMLDQWAQRIHDFRALYGFAPVWEVADESGALLGEFYTLTEITAAMNKRKIPANVLCRRNRVGQWRPVDSALPKVSRLTPAGAGALTSPQSSRALTLLVLLAAATVGAFLVYQVLALLQYL